MDSTPGSKAVVSAGIHDIGVGVTAELLAGQLTFWRSLGYEPAQRGHLPAEHAEPLYGVASALDSTLLRHLQAPQGLVRLMCWDRPVGPGLQMAGLRTRGTRWSVHKTDDLLTVNSHAQTLRLQGREISIAGPVINARSARPLEAQRPFESEVPCSYNLQIFQPLSQVVIMQRQHIDTSGYGTINPGALLRTSQACHLAIVIDGFHEAYARFYEQALGLRRSGVVRLGYEPTSVATIMFDLQPGEVLTEIDLDDPCGPGAKPGRLRLFFVEGHEPLPDATRLAEPGNLGYSLYAYRTRDVHGVRDRVISAGAAMVTQILHDEFGLPSFCFRSPDGYYWQISGEKA